MAQNTSETPTTGGPSPNDAIFAYVKEDIVQYPKDQCSYYYR